ncbi:serine/threonine-protein kinase 19-like, partial [Acipenser oxyrinchus oxyrinchus]
LASLFPHNLFNDTLPPIVLKYRLHSITQEKKYFHLTLFWGILMLHLGFDTDAFVVVFAEDYIIKAMATETGRETLGTMQKFLESIALLHRLEFQQRLFVPGPRNDV